MKYSRFATLCRRSGGDELGWILRAVVLRRPNKNDQGQCTGRALVALPSCCTGNVMISTWVLIAGIAAGFYLGVILMSILTSSRDRERMVQARPQPNDGLHPLDSPSRA
jgi:hypothetical protein